MKKLKISFNAPVVLTFIMICFIATVLDMITGGRSTESFFMTFHSSFLNPMTYIRMITHVFGHDGWEHFIGNASYILLLGPMLEEKYGSGKLAGAIATTAVATALVNHIFFWNIGLCGASGVVFTFILLTSFTSFKDGEIPLTFILIEVIYIGQQVIEGVMIVDNVSNMAHIVGGFVGAVIGYNLNKKSKYRF